MKVGLPIPQRTEYLYMFAKIKRLYIALSDIRFNNRVIYPVKWVRYAKVYIYIYDIHHTKHRYSKKMQNLNLPCSHLIRVNQSILCRTCFINAMRACVYVPDGNSVAVVPHNSLFLFFILVKMQRAVIYYTHTHTHTSQIIKRATIEACTLVIFY